MNFLYAPFPRPKRSRRNVFYIVLIGVLCSLFIIIFNPFNIINQQYLWYINLILIGLGLVFSLSVLFIEFVVPSIFPKPFKQWTLLKAIIWYSLATLFVSATVFLFKSLLGGFNDFNWLEYVLVLGRVLSISLTVSFFILGIINYFNRKSLSLLSSHQHYTIQSPQAKPINILLDQVLFIVSDDNYVDIHLKVEGKRKKEVFRSSLKNIEDQLVHPVSPIHRCHRQYLININYFNIHQKNSRSMSISLQDGPDEIPVSKKYADSIERLLHTRP